MLDAGKVPGTAWRGVCFGLAAFASDLWAARRDLSLSLSLLRRPLLGPPAARLGAIGPECAVPPGQVEAEVAVRFFGVGRMVDAVHVGRDQNQPQATVQMPQPNPDLKSLDRLVGTWKVTGRKSLPSREAALASSLARSTACSGVSSTPGYLTRAMRPPSGSGVKFQIVLVVSPKFQPARAVPSAL